MAAQSTIELRRQPVVTPLVDETPPVIELALRGETELHYRGLRSHLSPQSLELLNEKAKLPLLTALQQMGKDIFPTAEVKVYQVEKERQHWLSLGWPGRHRFTTRALTLISMMSAFCFTSAWVTTSEDTPFTRLSAILAASALASVAAAIPMGRMAHKISGWGWAKVALSEYRHPIPEFALDTALRLKERLPRVGLYVEYYTNETLVGDPFLIASDGYQEIYLEVWEEVAFERRE